MKYYVGCYVAGIARFGTFKNCKNTGALSLTGTATSDEPLSVAGISIRGTNTGCSNSGTIKAKGIVGERDYPIFAAGVSVAPDKISSCSNSGKVSGKKGSLFVGGILGSYDNGAVNSIGKYFVYDNYSTTSPLYGRAQISWEPYWARKEK